MGKKKGGGKAKRRQQDNRGYSTGGPKPSGGQKSTTQSSGGGGGHRGSPSKPAVPALLKLPYDIEEKLLLLLHGTGRGTTTAGTGPDSGPRQRVTKRRLVAVYDTLEDLGFTQDHVEAAITAQLGAGIEAALDWLCLHVPNSELPKGYTDKALGGLHMGSIECVPRKPAPPAPPRTADAPDDPAAPDLSRIVPAALVGTGTMQELRPKQERELEGLDAAVPAVKASSKSWILQYAENYTSSEDEEGADDAAVNAALSPTDRLCGLECQLTELMAAAAFAKVAGDGPAQKENGLKIRQCRAEIGALEAHAHDPAALSAHRAAEQAKRDADRTGRKAAKDAAATAAAAAAAAAAAVEAATSGAGAAASTDDEGGLGLFDGDDGDADEPEPDPAAGVTAEELKAQDRGRWPNEFDYGGWTGATPTDLLGEWCRDKARRPPKFTKQGGRGSYRFSVVVEPNAGAGVVEASFSSTVKTVSEGRDLASTLALYQVASDQRINTRMPPAFQAVWDRLAARTKLQEAERQSAQYLRRDTFLETMLAVAEERSATAADDGAAADGGEDGSEEPSAADQGRDKHGLGGSRSQRPRSGPTSGQIRAAAPEVERQRCSLPATLHRQEVLDVVQEGQVAVISGDTGCGKSTQIPQLILRAALAGDAATAVNIICTQPRRISAVTIAERVASEMGGTAGGLCGYQVRLDNKTSRDTRLTYCTTGILLRRLQGDPKLEGVTHVVVDEIHERSIDSDFLLVILKRLLPRRPDLKVVLMSATLNAEAFSQYFWGCAVLSIPGRAFPVTQLHLEDVVEATGYTIESDSPYCKWTDELAEHDDPRHGATEERQARHADHPLSETTVTVLGRLDESRINYDLVEHMLLQLDQLGCDADGSVLVFMPGMAEIMRLYNLLMSNRAFYEGGSWEIIALHSAISKTDQARAFVTMPARVRKVVIATNIAETGITIPDCTVVIDTGKEKQMRFRENTRVSCLEEVFISKASARQRAGRAGRVQPGICLRTYSSRKHNRLADFTPPEMSRSPLESLVLYLLASGYGTPAEVLGQTIDPPTQRALANAEAVLLEVGAIAPENQERDAQGKLTTAARRSKQHLTPLGRHLAKLPVEVHLGKMMIFGAVFGCLDPVLTIASSVSHGSPFVAPFNKREAADAARRKFMGAGESDLLAMLAAHRAWERSVGKARAVFCRENFVSESVMTTIAGLKREYAGLISSLGFDAASAGPANANAADTEVVKAVIVAGLYPHVAVMTKRTSAPPVLALQNGGEARVHPSSSLASVRGSGGGGGGVERCAVFASKLKTSDTYCRDCTLVGPVPILLFAEQMAVQHDQGVIVVDGWIKIRAPAKTAVIFKHLKAELNAVLAQKSANPRLPVDRVPLIRAIVQLISSGASPSPPLPH